VLSDFEMNETAIEAVLTALTELGRAGADIAHHFIHHTGDTRFLN